MEARKPPAVTEKKFGPERRYYDRLKGRDIEVLLVSSQDGLQGKLLWVDRYTLGLALNGQNEVAIYKHAIKMVRPLRH